MSDKWDLLKIYLEDRQEMSLGEAEMYSQNEQDLFSNADELAWGCRCKANEAMLILEKMKRLEEKERTMNAQ